MTFDADLEHPWATRWRIPRITSPYPERQYEVAVCVPGPDGESRLWGALEPTDADAEIIASYLEYRCAYYRPGWLARMRKRPFDIDDTTNTVTLMLTADGWKYQQRTWRHGPWPFRSAPEEADYPPTTAGLLALLDRINGLGGSRWAQWKTGHAEIFAVAEPDGDDG